MIQNVIHSLLADNAATMTQDISGVLTFVGLLAVCHTLTYCWRIRMLSKQSAH